MATCDEPVVYIHGAGEAFCAGADLGTVESLDRESAVAFAKQGQQVAKTISEYDGAVIAGIDGPARGGGVELALACDMRIGTPTATLAETGVSLGFFGAWGGTDRLPAIVGEGNAMDLSLSGRIIDADEALRMGLLSRVVEEPLDVARTIAGHDPEAIRAITERLRSRKPKKRQEQEEATAFGNLIESFDPD